jgi:hypothetical protein
MTEEEKAKNKLNFIDLVSDHKVNLEVLYDAADKLFKNGSIERQSYISLINDLDSISNSFTELWTHFTICEKDAEFQQLLERRVGF